MGLILAAAPYEDFVRSHSPLLVAMVVLLLAALTIRLVIKTMTRLILLSLLGLMALFVLIERDDIRQCTQTCECNLVGFDVELPACDPDLIASAPTRAI